MKIYYSYNSVPEFAELSPRQIEKLSAESFRCLLRKWKFWAAFALGPAVYVIIVTILGNNDVGRFAGGIIGILSIQFIGVNMRISIMKERLKNLEKQ
jgi:hypothetical protein